MSVWSAAYFNRLAAAHGLRERAIARAAVPSYSAVPLNMTFALAIDGFRLDGYRPEVISAEDARAANSSSPSTRSSAGGASERSAYGGLAGIPTDA
jgi:hypothetical protein